MGVEIRNELLVLWLNVPTLGVVANFEKQMFNLKIKMI
jgi:hypothetical protein